jgi:DNA replication protein DnaC
MKKVKGRYENNAIKETGAITESTYTCKFCKQKYTFTTRTGETLKPTICEKCNAERKEQEHNARIEKRLNTLPYRDWDNEIAGPAKIALRNAIGKIVFADKKPTSQSVWVAGKSGSGKTRSLCFLAGLAIERGYNVRYVDCISMLMDYSSSFTNGDSEEVMHSIANDERVVILDDYGVGKLTERGAELLYNIANTRMVKKLPTWISSNIMPSQLSEWFPKELHQYATRIKRRILDTVKIIETKE